MSVITNPRRLAARALAVGAIDTRTEQNRAIEAYFSALCRESLEQMKYEGASLSEAMHTAFCMTPTPHSTTEKWNGRGPTDFERQTLRAMVLHLESTAGFNRAFSQIADDAYGRTR